MTDRDHQISTRDLAPGSDDDRSDLSFERPRPADRTTEVSATGDQEDDLGFDNAAQDADTGTDSAVGDGGGRLGSGQGDTEGEHVPSATGDHEPLFASDQSERFTSRWREIQTSFVDQPRDAVAEADALVADLMQRLAGSFSQERERLEAQWDRGDDVSTEDLRVALTRYRSFFDRLLSA